MDLSRDYVALARQALAAYDLISPTLSFIQHSENVTFRVQSGSETYLLRLHEPRSPNFGSHGSDTDAIRSELLWLAALHRSKFLVQRPVRSRAGQLVTSVDRVDGGPVNCSLLSWLEGELY